MVPEGDMPSIRWRDYKFGASVDKSKMDTDRVTFAGYGDSVDHDSYRTTFDFTGMIKQVAFDLSGGGDPRRRGHTRHGLSKQ
jgi:hypothetical protein